MRISDWSSDVCSSDLFFGPDRSHAITQPLHPAQLVVELGAGHGIAVGQIDAHHAQAEDIGFEIARVIVLGRSEEHTSELQSLMRISYAVFCLKKKNKAP